MRALVIGADGFAGRWLLRHLLESGDEVVAAVGPRYHDEAMPSELRPVRLDVRDAATTRDVVTEARPDVTYYLAGVSRAGARDDLDLAIGISVQGALNVLGALAGLDRPSRIIHIGSSHMYATPADETPVTEDAPIRPSTVYGAAKAAAESALLHLSASAGVEAIAIRAFNHIGPGQAPGFVVSSLSEQVSRIARSEQKPVIEVGNVESRRDFTDVRDVVRAYRLAAVMGVPGEAYNVASGRAVSVQTVLDHLVRTSGVTVEVAADPQRTRSGESPHALVGDSSKLARLTGWQPQVSLKQTLADVMDAILEPSWE